MRLSETAERFYSVLKLFLFFVLGEKLEEIVIYCILPEVKCIEESKGKKQC